MAQNEIEIIYIWHEIDSGWHEWRNIKKTVGYGNQTRKSYPTDVMFDPHKTNDSSLWSLSLTSHLV